MLNKQILMENQHTSVFVEMQRSQSNLHSYTPRRNLSRDRRKENPPKTMIFFNEVNGLHEIFEPSNLLNISIINIIKINSLQIRNNLKLPDSHHLDKLPASSKLRCKHETKFHDGLVRLVDWTSRRYHGPDADRQAQGQDIWLLR